MTRFTEIEGTVLLRKNGIFTEAKLYERNKEVFAKRGAGFIRILDNGQTSIRGLIWDELDLDRLYYFPMARLTLGQPQKPPSKRAKRRDPVAYAA